MKRIFVIFTTFITASCFAQSPGNGDMSIYSFDNAQVGYGKEVHRLGTNPEFPFLRNMSSSDQVYASIKRNEKRHTRGMKQLNSLVMSIGYTNGVDDLTASSITEERIPYGTEGNMGGGGYHYGYYKLVTDRDGTKAWKISDGDKYVYILAKCGNAFYPNTPQKTACLNVPVSLTGDTKDVTLESGAVTTTSDKVFVYYHRRHRARRPLASEFSDVPDRNASNPVLIDVTNKMSTSPQTYRVTVTTPQSQVTAYNDQTLNVPTAINVEKESEFTGNYPASSKNYEQVSKRHYKRIARKMRKAERKENKVAKATGVQVDVPARG